MGPAHPTEKSILKNLFPCLCGNRNSTIVFVNFERKMNKNSRFLNSEMTSKEFKITIFCLNKISALFRNFRFSKNSIIVMILKRLHYGISRPRRSEAYHELSLPGILVLRHERRPTVNHLVEDDAHRPPVTQLRVP